MIMVMFFTNLLRLYRLIWQEFVILGQNKRSKIEFCFTALLKLNLGQKPFSLRKLVGTRNTLRGITIL